ncbi:SET domain-containing protein [Tuber magnatum]|uniref:SET domain-containing protein n=1 Tax=Tuber magnatum TaxID=42249 RepID=A0A317SSC5_9PEZI|nr:SET domain-containing protein [Tuber magnatum]
MAGCDCPGGCKPDTCSCNYDYRGLGLEWLEDSGFAYDQNGRVTRPNNIGITECNILCKCSMECQNRVVQRGREVKLQIFMTRECGWGLRTLEPIPKGTYIDSYLGLVITRAEAERREAEYRQSGLSYLFDLDFFEKSNENSMNCGMEKTLEALELIESPETPDSESAETQHPALLQKKRRRATRFGNSRKRRAKGPFTTGNGRGQRNQKEVEALSEYEEIGEFRVKQEKVPFGYEEVGQSSRTATRNHSVERTSEVSAAHNLERSTSTTPEDYRLRSYSLDSKDMGNVTRFSNHSCDPNLDIYSVVTGSHEIFTLALFANRDITAGSELTFSYSGTAGLERAKEKKKQLKNRKNKKGGEDTELFKCRCGTTKCVGYYWN